ncbi:MAG: cation:proton antiporter [Candidatus Saganbacteria bacterium]|nr:cation:proton antiporter [Candidatus Saganbacteria bacterium]
MDPLFNIGIILLFGYVAGLIAEKIKLPAIVGYIAIGILLEPGFLGILPAKFISQSIVANNFVLAIITFSVGGSLAWSKIKELGKSIVWITVLEAEFAFVLVALGMAFLVGHGSFLAGLPLALLIAALASPTDPTATLAVVHEYSSDGPVTRTIMGVAASDDAMGIINFSLATALAAALMLGSSYINANSVVWQPLITIVGSVIMGIVFGGCLSFVVKLVKAPGALVAIVLGTIFSCFGLAAWFGLDQLLSVMTTGIVFVNLSRRSGEIFGALSKYFEELIFIIFFVLAGAHLRLDTLASSWLLIVVFVILRGLGKFLGTTAGAAIAGSPAVVKKYTIFGLLPQGGIVVGLALLVQQDPRFGLIAPLLVNLILGTTVIHEFLGPLFSRFAIKQANEAGKQVL